MTRFIWMGIVLQMAMVIGGHYSEQVLLLSGILGTAIPLVLGVWFGATVPRNMKSASTGGFLIGIIGAFIGVVAAILMGDQPWLLLTFAPLSSGIAGLLGAIIGMVAAGRHKTPAAA